MIWHDVANTTHHASGSNGLGIDEKRMDTRLTALEIETAKNLRDLFNKIEGGLRKGQPHRRATPPSESTTWNFRPPSLVLLDEAAQVKSSTTR
jgi:hypothetical protein